MLRDLFLGFVKVHILHHAAREPVYGLWLIEELAHHGYELSPGTLYPTLHSLEREVADMKGRVNGLIFVVAGAVVTQVVLKLVQ